MLDDLHLDCGIGVEHQERNLNLDAARGISQTIDIWPWDLDGSIIQVGVTEDERWLCLCLGLNKRRDEPIWADQLMFYCIVVGATQEVPELMLT